MVAFYPLKWLNYKPMDDIIKRGERWPVETRMEMPEQSYAQELLSLPIPFENRVEFLSDYSKIIDRKQTAIQMSKILNTSKEVIVRIANDVSADIIDNSSEGEPIYEANTLEVIESEIEWRVSYEKLDDIISVKVIAAFLGKEEIWVNNRLNELNIILPPETRMSSGHIGRGYDKKIVIDLRHLMLHAPPAKNMYNLQQMEVILGRHRDWIRPRLEKLGYAALSRTSILSGEVGLYFKDEALEALQVLNMNLAPPAGDWLTVGTIAKALSKDRKWVLARIGEYDELSEIRRDDFDRELVHYPPLVLEELTKLVVTVPMNNYGWLTEDEVAEMLCKSRGWVKKRAGSESVNSSVLLDQNNRPRMHYSPEIIDTLQLNYLIEEENKLEI